jgi:hypothetical protein
VAKKALELKAWDRRPWPDLGDPDPQITFAAVGEALSHWEHLEGLIASLFASFVSDHGDNLPAKRAYVAVRTFEGRMEMLRASAEAFFSAFPDEGLQDTYQKFLKSVKEFAPRRNDIAHGVVAEFYRNIDNGLVYVPGYFALYPTIASFKQRSIDGIPAYCMGSAEIKYFSNRFRSLLKPSADLRADIDMKRLSRKASRVARELNND